MEALRILLIEPDRHARDFLRFLLEVAYTGIIVTTVRTAVDGAEMLQERRYDIVICDDSLALCYLKQLCDQVGCSVIPITNDHRLKPSDLHPLHPNLPPRGLLYKPIKFSDFCQNLHKAVLAARSRLARTSRRRSGRMLQPRPN